MADIAIEILAEKLKAKRQGKGVREVAREIGISPATYSRVENSNLPDLETFKKLCNWVGIEPNDILKVKTSSAASAPSIHFKNDIAMSKQVATAMGEMILKAQQAMMEDNF